jgi:hypothetical protein
MPCVSSDGSLARSQSPHVNGSNRPSFPSDRSPVGAGQSAPYIGGLKSTLRQKRRSNWSTSSSVSSLNWPSMGGANSLLIAAFLKSASFMLRFTSCTLAYRPLPPIAFCRMGFFTCSDSSRFADESWRV